MGNITVSWDLEDEEVYDALLAGANIDPSSVEDKKAAAAEALKNSVAIAVLDRRATLAAIEAKKVTIESNRGLAESFSIKE